jgi:hypothetical protein
MKPTVYQQEILKSVNPFKFHCIIRKWEDVNSGQNLHGFGSLYVDGHCIKMYAYIILLKQPAATHFFFFL